ncbi:hypothetical protein [Allomuricauda sp. d1]|uniref:hypothetical protein n=1 Tax=Allomuricauda sp. d1 TaxID=3136725 RepID=UPI0031E237BB
MKKTLAIMAVLVFGMGMISCEADTSVEDTEALFETLDTDATDGDVTESEERDGGS